MPTSLRPALRLAETALLLATMNCPLMGQQQAQDPQPPVIQIPEIPDAPRNVDPAGLVHEKLAQKMTVTFEDSSLPEVADWIQQNAEIPVLFDSVALDAAGISTSELVADSLNDDALYLMLNRLGSLNISWYVQDDIVRITSSEAAATHMVTRPYTVGDLLDRNFETDVLYDVITGTLGGTWEEVDGDGGTAEFLGDVLFVRQTNDIHLRLSGLLSALRNHGRQTFSFDPPEHILLRQKQSAAVSVTFDDVPLIEAAAALSKQAGIDIRLDNAALKSSRIRERQPVTLHLADRKLQTILEIMLAELELTTMIGDGVLWITSQERAAEQMRTAVYDVRDLCRDDDEAYALSDAIQTQTGDNWIDSVGEGGQVVFARPGVMVVRQTDHMHQRVLMLLEAYRSALKASKPRAIRQDPKTEIITRYYRTQSEVAAALLEFLPAVIAPESWKNAEREEAPGEILAHLPGGKTVLSPKSEGKVPLMSASATTELTVLVIRQTRENHMEIQSVVRRIENGDERVIDPNGAQQYGGFGGGYFSIPSPATK